MHLPIVRGRTFFEGEQNAGDRQRVRRARRVARSRPRGQDLESGGCAAHGDGRGQRQWGEPLLRMPIRSKPIVPIQGTDVERSALILHSRSDPVRSARMVPAAVNKPVSVSLMRALRESFLDGQRKMITLIGSIGALATILAAAGMFALVAFAVAQRKRELGIRMAIGAKRRHILGVLLIQHVKPTMSGAVVGVILAMILSRLVRSFVVFPNRDAVEVPGFAAGLVCFALVAGLATLSPAMRALRIDPSETLREE